MSRNCSRISGQVMVVVGNLSIIKRSIVERYKMDITPRTVNLNEYGNTPSEREEGETEAIVDG